MIRTRDELADAVAKRGHRLEDYRVAVAALILCEDGRVLLEKRGYSVPDEPGKLEGVGGGLQDFQDLHERLQNEIRTELANQESLRDIDVSIDGFLDFEFFTFTPTVGEESPRWVVVTYLCRLRSGIPDIGEPNKVEALKYLTLDELFAWPVDGEPADALPDEKKREALSPWTVHVREVYKKRYGSQAFWEV